MTVKELINYIECMPVKTDINHPTADEALLSATIKMRVPHASGVLSSVLDIKKVSLDGNQTIIIETGYVI